ETVDLEAIPVPNLPTTVTWNLIHTLMFDGEDISSQLSPTALPHTTGWYVVTITNDAGCVTSDSVLVIVDPYKPIYIPNVFSANGDDVNDYLTVYGNQAATMVRTFQVYDRWGGRMFENTNFFLNEPQLGWDGTYHGKPVNPGVFTYVAVVEFLDEIPVTYHGTVTVLR
ncbi:MAG TPA: gliding motility-associated C-terminal domain-containing protein, partial [Saprospiraceae bacterium]